MTVTVCAGTTVVLPVLPLAGARAGTGICKLEVVFGEWQFIEMFCVLMPTTLQTSITVTGAAPLATGAAPRWRSRRHRNM
jgi:hypothetical protein